MTKLEKAKEIITKNYSEGDCGIFNTRNIAGDWMTTIYADGELTINICYYWNYFEVFGLSSKEFADLEKYYSELGDS